MNTSDLISYIYKNTLNSKLRESLEYILLGIENFFKFYRKFMTKEVKNSILQKYLTKHYLDFVEIEIFSFCNRRCWFCPNSFIDRHSKNIFMKEDTYLKVMRELKAINYQGAIAYSRYNEPTSDRIFLKRLRQARELLPNAFLFTHSNGDYINREYIDELADAGLNLIRLQCYLKKDEKFDIENVVKPQMEKYAQRVGLQYKEGNKNDTYYSIVFEHPKMSIICEAIDFPNSYGVNRGETIDGMVMKTRNKPCMSPYKRMYIDYDGSVMPCCQVRHDIDKHKSMILGNVEKNTIYEIFTNEKTSALRNHLGEWGQKIHPCTTCLATEADNVFDKNLKLYVLNMRRDFKK